MALNLHSPVCYLAANTEQCFSRPERLHDRHPAVLVNVGVCACRDRTSGRRARVSVACGLKLRLRHCDRLKTKELKKAHLHVLVLMRTHVAGAQEAEHYCRTVSSALQPVTMAKTGSGSEVRSTCSGSLPADALSFAFDEAFGVRS